MFAYQGIRNVNFSENFAYVIDKWSLAILMKVLNLNIFLGQELEVISKKINYDHHTKVMEISNLKRNQVIFNTLNYLYNLPIPENKYLKKPH